MSGSISSVTVICIIDDCLIVCMFGLVSWVNFSTSVEILALGTGAIITLKTLPPVHFQPGLDTFQHHRPHATHQGEKFLTDNPKVLSDTGVFCGHIDDL